MIKSRFGYTLLIWALLPQALLHLLWRALRQPAYLKHVPERFGSYSGAAGQPLIWVHAVSVGETRGAQPLIRALQRKYPQVLAEAHGKGLLIGMEFPVQEIGWQVAAGLFKRGVLVAGTYSKAQVIRIEPALGIPQALLQEMLNRLEDTFKEVARKGDDYSVVSSSAASP